ncbi:MAG TPA: family 1 glycosylhydrolase, partial [Vicinamibacterales bacterium]|nr:family 1 glycosylhydrolase [Vicinamibacterales bacterium]
MIEIWGGIECTVNRVQDRWYDQVLRSGHHARPGDLDRMAALGIRTLRYPVLWERVVPARGEFDWRWTDERLARLRALGIRPIVGLLHHGSGPAFTSLTDPAFPALFAAFARAVAERYPWIEDYTPINEPLTTARFSGLYGHWYPHRRDDPAFVRALLHQVHGIAGAMRAIRGIVPQARLVQTEDCGRSFGTVATAAQVRFEEQRRWLTFDLLTGRVTSSHPLWRWLTSHGAVAGELAPLAEQPCAPDVVGLNYYLTSDRFLDHRLDRYPAACHGGNGATPYADVEAVRARPEGIVGHEAHLLDAWERYRLPLAITEAHLSCSREEQIRWFAEAVRGAEAARTRGADVRAVTAWALFGSFDWDSLVTRDAGHYEPGAFDVRASPPRPTAVASVVRDFAQGRRPSLLAAIDGTPWWQRPERLIYGPAVAAVRPASADRPLLVVGATGTLGRAFQRICDQRGLRARAVTRSDADITDPTSVDAIIRHVQPWAVVNAAGYVRVDAAEHDGEGCRRANVTGAVNLAAACRRRRVPFVTFSSDLVFDGRAGRPYVEEDEPNPINVYGVSKMEAERRVLDLADDALVIRTSAFFGPWDDYNFLVCLLRALDAGEPFRAAGDTTVSPTYVPHLVHGTLDLLIDGARGIWHLANDGAVTWFDFACAAAEAAGRSVDLIERVAAAAVWSPAPRPAYSALASSRGAMMPPLAAALGAFARD